MCRICSLDRNAFFLNERTEPAKHVSQRVNIYVHHYKYVACTHPNMRARPMINDDIAAEFIIRGAIVFESLCSQSYRPAKCLLLFGLHGILERVCACLRLCSVRLCACISFTPNPGPVYVHR